MDIHLSVYQELTILLLYPGTEIYVSKTLVTNGNLHFQVTSDCCAEYSGKHDMQPLPIFGTRTLLEVAALSENVVRHLELRFKLHRLNFVSLRLKLEQGELSVRFVFQ
jgi:hypothetical protein